jgi:hypothetical protein
MYASMARLHRVARFALIALVIAGCAAPAPRIQQRQYKVDLSPYNALWVSVDASKDVATAEGLEITSVELRREFMDQLRARTTLPVLELAPAEGKAAEVRLTITALNYISGATRGMSMIVPIVGLAKGRSALGVDMTLIDKESGAVVWRLSAGQTERYAQNPLSATTSSQISDIAKEFAERLAAAAKR